MTLTPNQKSVLITGCSSGIGYAMAEALRAKNYLVVTSARKSADVERLREQGFHAVQLDLDSSASITAGLSATLEITEGSLYGLFNNAGFGQPGAVEDLRREVIRAQFETNLFGPLELTNQILPLMRRQGYGRIIQNSSLLGFVALPYRGAYNSVKHALEGLTDTLRLELDGTNIGVSLIEPGPITSRFRANAFAAYKSNIDSVNSAHAARYAAIERRLTKPGPAAPFTLPPSAILPKLLHALESPSPRARYYVTVPTYFFAWARRLLTNRALDQVLLRVGKNEHK